MPRHLDLPTTSHEALELLRASSANGPVVVLKKSPTCPISHRAEFEFKQFLGGVDEDALTVAWIDVIAERELARGLVAELGIEHESPQALWFGNGELVWHASHGALNRAAFQDRLANA